MPVFSKSGIPKSGSIVRRNISKTELNGAESYFLVVWFPVLYVYIVHSSSFEMNGALKSFL